MFEVTSSPELAELLDGPMWVFDKNTRTGYLKTTYGYHIFDITPAVESDKFMIDAVSPSTGLGFECCFVSYAERAFERWETKYHRDVLPNEEHFYASMLCGIYDPRYDMGFDKDGSLREKASHIAIDDEYVVERAAFDEFKEQVNRRCMGKDYDSPKRAPEHLAYHDNDLIADMSSAMSRYDADHRPLENIFSFRSKYYHKTFIFPQSMILSASAVKQNRRLPSDDFDDTGIDYDELAEKAEQDSGVNEAEADVMY